MDDRPPFDVTVREEKPHGGSFFWPVILIAVGVVILLRDAGILPAFNWGSLWRLWPVLLIMAGIDMLFGRRLRALGALFGLAVVVGAVFLLMWGPSLGWDSARLPGFDIPALFESPGEIKTSHFDESVDDVQSADIVLDLGPYRTQVGVVSDQDSLIQADIEHYYDMQFDVSGGANRRIVLDETSQGPGGFSIHAAAERYLWDIRLNPDLPIDLSVDMSSGQVELSLSDLDIRELDLECSSGDIDAVLPRSLEQLRFRGSSGDSYIRLAPDTEARMRIDMSSGRVVWSLDENSDLDILVEDGSSGDLVFEMPSDTAIQLSVLDDSSGSVRVPREMERISGLGEDMTGTWETRGYERARHQVEIVVEEMSSGDIIIRYLD